MAAPVIPIFDVPDFEQQLDKAAEALKASRIVVLPTETVYGAAAVLTDAAAMQRLRSLPPPSKGKPLVIHLAHRDDAKPYLNGISELAQRMMRKLWPGPVALVFDVPPDHQRQTAANLGIPPDEIYTDGSITLRCPDHIVAQTVIARAVGPVVMRKIGGRDQSGQTVDHMDPAWRDQVDIVFDAGRTRYSKPSTIVKIAADKYEIIRAGIYDQRIIENMLRTTILFVCSGNTCRSPMAEALTRQMIAKKLEIPESDLEKRGIVVLSAGSFAMPGAKATQAAVDALRPTGADLSRHRSRPLTVELIHQADVIYTMARGHAQAVRAIVPSAADKIMTLDPSGDIEDPIGGDVSLYQSLAVQLRELIEKRLAERSIP